MEKLSFIRENDIYALLGNILDNAIEASEKRKKDEERVVSISTIAKKGLSGSMRRTSLTGT